VRSNSTPLSRERDYLLGRNKEAGSIIQSSIDEREKSKSNFKRVVGGAFLAAMRHCTINQRKEERDGGKNWKSLRNKPQTLCAPAGC